MADVECTQRAPANNEVIAPETRISRRDATLVRHLTVSYRYPKAPVRRKSPAGIVPPVPLLRVQGQWLARAGFAIGERVRVRVGARRLIIEVNGR
jgi:hypothetical protein